LKQGRRTGAFATTGFQEKQSLIGFAKIDFLEIISHRRRSFVCDEKSNLSKAIVCLSPKEQKIYK
jgi:hypothetical protein